MTALRTSAARLAGEASVRALRRLGRGGTALPGLLLQTIDPGWIQEAAGRLTAGSVIITGTNGKTTTARLVAAMESFTEAAAAASNKAVPTRIKNPGMEK